MANSSSTKALSSKAPRARGRQVARSPRLGSRQENSISGKARPVDRAVDGEGDDGQEVTVSFRFPKTFSMNVKIYSAKRGISQVEFVRYAIRRTVLDEEGINVDQPLAIRQR
jgi:hypothetical protein